MKFLQALKSKGSLQLLFLIAGILFIVLGIFSGEVAIVLQKATSICLECIGIG